MALGISWPLERMGKLWNGSTTTFFSSLFFFNWFMQFPTICSFLFRHSTFSDSQSSSLEK